MNLQKQRFLMGTSNISPMSHYPDEQTKTDPEPEPDSPEPPQASHGVWITSDRHHFEHQIADARWTETVDSSRSLCVDLTDRMVRHLSAPLCAGVEISILWTNDRQMAALNRRFRQKSGATNILSFPSQETFSWTGEELFLGDLALGYETVMVQAELAGKPTSHHVAHLVLHGLLHLAGFDHIQESEASEMEALETHLLAEVGISDPYDKATDQGRSPDQ